MSLFPLWNTVTSEECWWCWNISEVGSVQVPMGPFQWFDSRSYYKLLDEQMTEYSSNMNNSGSRHRRHHLQPHVVWASDRIDITSLLCLSKISKQLGDVVLSLFFCYCIWWQEDITVTESKWKESHCVFLCVIVTKPNLFFFPNPDQFKLIADLLYCFWVWGACVSSLYLWS